MRKTPQEFGGFPSLEAKRAYHREYRKRWRAKNPGAHKRSHFRLTYGLSLEAGLALQAAGACDMCGGHCEKREIDHCHQTGVVRGGVCAPCNMFLQKLEWTPEADRLAQALLYLRRSRHGVH